MRLDQNIKASGLKTKTVSSVDLRETAELVTIRATSFRLHIIISHFVDIDMLICTALKSNFIFHREKSWFSWWKNDIILMFLMLINNVALSQKFYAEIIRFTVLIWFIMIVTSSVFLSFRLFLPSLFSDTRQVHSHLSSSVSLSLVLSFHILKPPPPPVSLPLPSPSPLFPCSSHYSLRPPPSSVCHSTPGLFTTFISMPHLSPVFSLSNFHHHSHMSLLLSLPAWLRISH